MTHPRVVGVVIALLQDAGSICSVVLKGSDSDQVQVVAAAHHVLDGPPARVQGWGDEGVRGFCSVVLKGRDGDQVEVITAAHHVLDGPNARVQGWGDEGYLQFSAQRA